MRADQAAVIKSSFKYGTGHQCGHELQACLFSM